MSFYENKIFPFLNDILSSSLEGNRRKLLQSVSGRILEIGFGSGLSICAYPKGAKVTGLEPSKAMLEKAKIRTSLVTEIELEIVQGTSESLPFGDRSFDFVVSFLTLCTVNDLEKSVAEIKRVLRDQGQLLLIEHMGQTPGTWTRKLQDGLNAPWNKIACGCNLNRDTEKLLLSSGFEVLHTKTLGYDGFPNLVSPLKRMVLKKEQYGKN